MNQGDPPHPGISLPRPGPGSAPRPTPTPRLSSSLEAKCQAEDQGPAPKVVGRALCWHTWSARWCPADRNSRDRVFRPPLPPTDPPSSSLHGWLLTHVGASPAGASTRRARARWGRRAAGLRAQCAVCICVSDVCVPFTCAAAAAALSFSRPCPLQPPCPAPGTHLPAGSWRSRSAGPDLSPPKASALPLVLSSV